MAWRADIARAVMPVHTLAFSTLYAVSADGLLDSAGNPVLIANVSFKTKDFVPPVYDQNALVFSYPDANGIVTLTAPAGSMPPGATVQIINGGNGDVSTFQVYNDGSIGVRFLADQWEFGARNRRDRGSWSGDVGG